MLQIVSRDEIAVERVDPLSELRIARVGADDVEEGGVHVVEPRPRRAGLPDRAPGRDRRQRVVLCRAHVPQLLRGPVPGGIRVGHLEGLGRHAEPIDQGAVQDRPGALIVGVGGRELLGGRQGRLGRGKRVNHVEIVLEISHDIVLSDPLSARDAAVRVRKRVVEEGCEEWPVPSVGTSPMALLRRQDADTGNLLRSDTVQLHLDQEQLNT